MLLHYCLEENPGLTDLNNLPSSIQITGIMNVKCMTGLIVIKSTWYIKRELYICLIPFEIMYKYAAIDAIVTFLIYLQIKPAVDKNTKLKKVYNGILIPASYF